MGNPYDEIKKMSGLWTHANPLNAPDGAMLVADEVEILREDMVTRRRGYRNMSSNLPAFRPEQMISIGNQLYLCLDNGLWYYDGTNWLRKRGALGAKSSSPAHAVILGNFLFYVANNCVLGIGLVTGSHSVIAGRYGVTGSADGAGSAALFNNLQGITTDGTSLYVCDDINNTIRKIAAPLTDGAGIVTTIAGSPGVTGSADGTGFTPQFNNPQGIASDGTNLYVCDTVNQTIRKIAPPLTLGAAVVTTIAGTVSTPGSANGTGAVARFFNPCAITSDGTSLYVCDQSNQTIRKLAAPLTAGAAVVTTIAGTAGSSGSADGIGSAARFSLPRGIASDNTNLYVCDQGNNTIRKIYSTGYIITLSGVVGSSSTTFGASTADGIVVGPT